MFPDPVKSQPHFWGYHTLLTGDQTEAFHRSVMHQYSESNPTVRLPDPNDGFSTLLLSLT